MTSPLADVQLHLVKSIDDVLACREWAGQRRDTPLCFDTETEGLQPVWDKLRLLQLGDKHHGWAFPAEWAGAAIELLTGYEGELGAHHSCFDHRVIRHSLGASIPWHRIHDTMILAALADPTKPKGLKPLAARLIDKNATAGQHLLDQGMKKNGWSWKTVPVDFPPFWVYASLDPVLTAWIYDQLADGVLASSPAAYDLERATVPVLAQMMDAGLLLDREYTTRSITRLREYAAQARQWLKSYHSVDSLMSARQLDAALQAQGVAVRGRTKTGLPAIDKDVLEAIAKSQDERVSAGARDLAATVLKARHAEKLAGTYLENFLELSTHDGAIHPSLQQLQARTGRMCLAAGTLVDGPRDLLAQPLGTPIENIRPGDPVYSFDDRGNIIVQRVRKVHNNGELPVLRLVYRRSGFHGGQLMELRATPDHRIALRTGEYRELQNLRPGDKLGFMMRTVGGDARSKLEWNGGKRVFEPRVICQPVADYEVVHHVNEKTLDQRPENLKALTTSQHMHEHAMMAMRAYGKEALLAITESDSSYHRIAKKLGVGPLSLMLRCAELGIPVRSSQESIKKHWESPCPLSPEDFWARMRELGGVETNTGGGTRLAVELGVSYNLIRKWKKEFAHLRPADVNAHPITADELADLIASSATALELTQRAGYSTHMLKRWCKELHVAWPSADEWAKRRIAADCPYTPSEFFTLLEQAGNVARLARSQGISYGKCSNWKKMFEESNHEVVAVIDDGEVLPVYDLEMDGFPNFVANELWVHNSCTDPNLQNLPRDDKIVRGCFTPRPGHVLISIDASQIEMRLFAAISGDEGLIRAFKQADAGGTDFYAALAGEIFEQEIAKSDPRRQAVKSASYARIYGAGVAKMALTAGVPVSQMRPVNDALGRRFPGINNLPGQLIAEARAQEERGERPGTRTSTGRWLPLDAGHLYAAANYRIQAEAAECLKRGGIALDAAGFGPSMRLFVHDEVILEVPAAEAEDALRTAAQVLTASNSYAVEIPWDGKIMRERWAK